MTSEADKNYMRLALSQARLSPPSPSKYCVGAILVDQATARVLATGYSMELPGNTHAEQCCLMKYAELHGLPEERVAEVLPKHAVVYTTMEPCSERLSGNLPCVDRIIATTRGVPGKGIYTVYSGIAEPDTFIKENVSKRKLQAAGIKYIHVPGCEDEILKVATAGHDKLGSTSS